MINFKKYSLSEGVEYVGNISVKGESQQSRETLATVKERLVQASSEDEGREHGASERSALHGDFSKVRDQLHCR